MTGEVKIDLKTFLESEKAELQKRLKGKKLMHDKLLKDADKIRDGMLEISGAIQQIDNLLLANKEGKI